MLLYVFYFTQPRQLQRADQHIANSRNSGLPTRIHPVQLSKSPKKNFPFLMTMVKSFHLKSTKTCFFIAKREVEMKRGQV